LKTWNFLQNLLSVCCKCYFRDPNFKMFLVGGGGGGGEKPPDPPTNLVPSALAPPPQKKKMVLYWYQYIYPIEISIYTCNWNATFRQTAYLFLDACLSHDLLIECSAHAWKDWDWPSNLASNFRLEVAFQLQYIN
jgi:hypothetical protein